MAHKAITLLAPKRGRKGRIFAKLGHRSDWWPDEDEYWSEPLLGIGYAESYGPLAPEDVIDEPELEREPIGFAY